MSKTPVTVKWDSRGFDEAVTELAAIAFSADASADAFLYPVIDPLPRCDYCDSIIEGDACCCCGAPR